jgi:hypothetical protein
MVGDVGSVAGLSQPLIQVAASAVFTPPGPDGLSAYVRIALSFAILACALAMIMMKRFGPKDKHWAYGIVGTIIGYWFRGA